MTRRSVRHAALIAMLAATSAVPALGARAQETATAIFAGGCFWCVESDFDKVPGVVSTTSGYTGGHVEDPTYEDVGSETSGHREAVRIEYNPAEVSYDQLLDVFWHSVDPTDGDGQFCDRGESYTTAIFAEDEEQRQAAEASKQELAMSDEPSEPVVTPVIEASTFYPAEDYHQNYYEKNPLKYRYYRWSCGRDSRLEEIWGDAAHRGIPSS